MTLGSCQAKKEDMVGAGPQKMAVNLSLIEQYVLWLSAAFFASSSSLTDYNKCRGTKSEVKRPLYTRITPCKWGGSAYRSGLA